MRMLIAILLSLPAVPLLAGTKAPRINSIDSFLAAHPAHLTVYIVFSTDCPISQKQLMSLAGIREKYSSGVNFVFVLPEIEGMKENLAMIEPVASYIYRDKGNVFCKKIKAKVVPTAYLAVERKIIYRGLVNDQFILGRQEKSPAQVVHFLENAIREYMEGKPISHPSTEASGCFIF